MRIAGTKSCSLVDGEGIRYVVFVQGCAHHCIGCHNPDTWDFDGGFEVKSEYLRDDILQHKMIDGITLSGGDPFYQEEECMRLLELLPDINVWVYTGFHLDEIRDHPLARRADILVPEPFDIHQTCSGDYFGSSNQFTVRMNKR